MTIKKHARMIGSLLDIAPVAIFFVAYFRFKDDVFTIGGTDYSGFIIVTAAFIPMLMLAAAGNWFVNGRISRMQVITIVLAVVFGGMSVALNDERFFKIKPTILYLALATLEAIGLLRGRYAVAYVMSESIPLTQVGWRVLARRILMLWVSLAIANEIVWRTLSTDHWVTFKTFGMPSAVMLFMISQFGVIRRYDTTRHDESD